jgi:hypothetical protein
MQLILKVMIRTNELTKIFRTEEVETTALNKVTLDVKRVNM